MKKKYKGAIFDLDGTLINSLDDLASSVNITLRHYGFPTFSTEEYRYKVGNGAKKLIERSLPPEKARDEKFVAEALARYKEIYEAHSADATKPYDGIIDALKKLAAGNVFLAVCTNKPEGAARQVVAEMLGGAKFQTVVGDDGRLPIKPDPAKVNLICRELKVNPEDMIFVGDSAVDMETAVNAGCLPVGVLWGFRDSDELKAAGAKILLESPAELLTKVDFVL